MAERKRKEAPSAGGGSVHRAKTTTDHQQIRAWVEEREGRPATVKGTAREGEAVGMLRVQFPGHGRDEALQEVPWEAFLKKFDEAGLAFLYQEKTEDGGMSRFFKFVRRR